MAAPVDYNPDLYDLFLNNVIDTTKWTGPDPTWGQKYFAQNIAICVLGTLWGIFFKIVFLIVDFLSRQFVPRYRTLNKMHQVDWSSRMVAMIFISICSYNAYRLIGQVGHTLVPIEDTDTTCAFVDKQWKLNTVISTPHLYLLFHYFAVVFGYELYDLKNCWDIKMMSGVLHHLVLLIIIPTNWTITTIAIPAVWMTTTTYFTNIPAHLRSFMVHTGYRDIPFYTWNKWAWWVSYIIFRLFGIPWFSSFMFYTMPALKAQSPLINIVWYFTAMAIHYGLSLYWFVEMTKTMFPMSASEMKRKGSFPLMPQGDEKENNNNNNNSKGGRKEVNKEKNARKDGASSGSEDEGGQKFD